MLEKKEKLSAENFKALKLKIKNEMNRRKYSGSLESYGASEYDFTIEPVPQKKILIDHANKIIEPMNAVNDSGFKEQKIRNPAIAMNTLNAKITAYASEPITSTNHYCSGLCSGLCSATCGGDCSGACTDTCADDCTGGCKTTCKGSCSGCTGTCEGDCTGNPCKGGCGDSTACDGYCWSSCSGTCKGQTCQAECKGIGCSGWCWDSVD